MYVFQLFTIEELVEGAWVNDQSVGIFTILGLLAFAGTLGEGPFGVHVVKVDSAKIELEADFDNKAELIQWLIVNNNRWPNDNS